MKKLRIGIAGPGSIARNVHIPGFQRHPETEVTAVFSRSKDRARLTAAEFGIPAAFDSYGEMIETGELDAVSICVPNKFHAEMAIQALEAGLHVFCEKPPAINAMEAAGMAAAADAAGKVLTFNLHWRHSPQTDVIRMAIKEGELGFIYAARIRALRRRGIPGWGVFTDRNLQGGGPLIDIGVHMLDTALYLMDYPPIDAVFAVAHKQIGPNTRPGRMRNWDPLAYSVEDSLMGLIRFRNGGSLTIETSFALNMAESEVMDIELFGDEGGASVFPPRLFQEKYNQLTDTEFPYLKAQDPHARSIANFVDACFGRQPILVTAGEAVELQRLMDALYESAAAGEAVKLGKSDSNREDGTE
ncbi:Gfo/Idh/MocA family protein [Indiicoccus explosivorum]|uniref:Gfo/Idh/MocA family protein n=1 Tax=Indiicoccus explosivorum TaxID=1917864 RepID=UPI000B43A825|nr:Gfo/Idh/MocA family oxidoreductase [Indiicoccus explosivorum]